MSNQPKTTSKENQPIQEYVIRVTPKNSKKYNVMRFSELDNVDFTKWKSVKLDREFSLKEYKSANGDEELPKFGAGSVFGAEQREESRKKRYQKYASRHRPEDQPWILNAKTSKQPSSSATNGSAITAAKASNSRKFRGIREGGVTDNTSYYVFFQAHDGAFEAFPVSEWYKFAPIPKFKALTAEEAEEQFTKRDKILNFFNVMNKKKGGVGELNDTMEDGIKPRRSRKDFKTSDMDDWNDFGGMSDGSDGDSDDGAKKKKGKKRGSDDEVDSEAKEESDEGDFDTREVDYMSDTSSDEDEDMAEKLNEELKGVEDEDALRQLVISDSEEEEENQTKDANKDETNGKQLTDKKSNNESTDVKVKQEKRDSDSSDSSDEDFDDHKFQSSIFMREVKPTVKKEPNADHHSAAVKRKLDTSDSQQGPSTASGSSSTTAKRPKTQGNEINLEETVKRYLMRKPITTTELIKNIRKMKVASSNEELVAFISQILKKLNPQKQQIQGKLYLYLNPNAK